jgi:hypothetical protein
MVSLIQPSLRDGHTKKMPPRTKVRGYYRCVPSAFVRHSMRRRGDELTTADRPGRSFRLRSKVRPTYATKIRQASLGRNTLVDLYPALRYSAALNWSLPPSSRHLTRSKSAIASKADKPGTCLYVDTHALTVRGPSATALRVAGLRLHS